MGSSSSQLSKTSRSEHYDFIASDRCRDVTIRQVDKTYINSSPISAKFHHEQAIQPQMPAPDGKSMERKTPANVISPSNTFNQLSDTEEIRQHLTLQLCDDSKGISLLSGIPFELSSDVFTDDVFALVGDLDLNTKSFNISEYDYDFSQEVSVLIGT